MSLDAPIASLVARKKTPNDRTAATRNVDWHAASKPRGAIDTYAQETKDQLFDDAVIDGTHAKLEKRPRESED